MLVWSWRDIFKPQLAIQNGGEITDVDVDYRVEEINGRTDYCFNVSELDCKSSEVDHYIIRRGQRIGIRYAGRVSVCGSLA